LRHQQRLAGSAVRPRQLRDGRSDRRDSFHQQFRQWRPPSAPRWHTALLHGRRDANHHHDASSPGPAPTPEPTTLVLLGTGAGIAAFKRLRGLRRSAKQATIAALVAVSFSTLLALPQHAAADCSDRATLSAPPEGEAVAARGVAYVRSIENDS